MDIQEKDTVFVIPCMTGETLQEGQPLSTAVYQAGSDLRRESQQHSSGKKVRNPDPDVEARQDFWSIIGDYVYRDHVAP